MESKGANRHGHLLKNSQLSLGVLAPEAAFISGTRLGPTVGHMGLLTKVSNS
jgi:hypothetical protein